MCQSSVVDHFTRGSLGFVEARGSSKIGSSISWKVHVACYQSGQQGSWREELFVLAGVLTPFLIATTWLTSTKFYQLKILPAQNFTSSYDSKVN